MRLSVTLKDSEHNALADMAKRNRVSIAWLVREAVREFLVRHGGQEQLPLNIPDPTTKEEHS